MIAPLLLLAILPAPGVTIDHRRVSVTQNDPERINAEVLPVERRKGLGR